MIYVAIDPNNSKPVAAVNNRSILEESFPNHTIVKAGKLEHPLAAYIFNPRTNQLEIDPNWTPPPDTPPSPDMTLSQAKIAALNQLVRAVQYYIESHYPEIKQRSDLADKEFYGSWLVTNVSDANGSPAYTTDTLYQRAFTHGQQIWLGSKTLQQILSGLQTNELPNLQPSGTYGGTRAGWEQEFLFAWEQLIKIAVRVAFVQACKNRYRQIKAQIEQSQTLQDLQNVQVPPQNMPTLPQEFR